MTREKSFPKGIPGFDPRFPDLGPPAVLGRFLQRRVT
jgi:hypothetical protein